MGTFATLFLLVYPRYLQKFSSVGIFVIWNVYFDRTIRDRFKVDMMQVARSHIMQVLINEPVFHRNLIILLFRMTMNAIMRCNICTISIINDLERNSIN